MNADECTDAVIGFLREKLRAATAPVMEEIVADIKESINIPDGGTKSKPIHSKPGEPPRRESGDYRNSWRAVTTVTGDEIRGVAGSNSFLGPILEKKMNRPHVAPAASRARADLPQRIKENL